MEFILGLILSCLISFIFYKKYRRKNNATLIIDQNVFRNWNPKPLISEGHERTNSSSNDKSPMIVCSKVGKWVKVDGKRLLNFASHNYLNFVEDGDVNERAKDAIYKYGVGSCGPRGFYGTVDVHLELESRLARFMNAESAIVYSYGFSTVASAIAAYAKKNDVVFADERINFALQRGIEASKCKTFYFKHNDMDDLEKHLKLFESSANKENRSKMRKFLIVEGIYVNTGKICPLPELIRIRRHYKLRLFIDEGVSFGVLGQRGRGVTEYFNVNNDDVDLIMATMEYALGTGGGFCVGSTFIVEHQRLAGLGYCFSASLPPFLAAAGCAAINILEKDDTRISKLHERCRELHEAVISNQIVSKYFELESDSPSPVKHLVFKNNVVPSHYDIQQNLLSKIVSYCVNQGILITTANFLMEKEYFVPSASIRLTVNCQLQSQEIGRLIKTLAEAAGSVLSTGNQF